MASKFIINDNRLIMSNCVDYHRDLLSNHDKTKGGGMFYIDRENNNLYLYDKSEEFGAAKIEDVKESVKRLPLRLRKMNIYFSDSLNISNAIKYGVKIKDAE
jgi:hypothetical protein